jgi:hypothetical protein
MSADDPDAAAAGETAEPDEDSEQVEIEDDEMADWGAVADDVADEPEDTDDDSESDDQADDQADEMPAMDPEKTSIGDVYCNALGMGAAVVRDNYGELDDDRAAAMDQYSDMARQLEIDQAVDDWLAEQGGIDSLSPGQSVAVFTVLFAVMVAVEDPTLAENAMQGVDGIA